jgi:hypothetical protein
MLQQHRATWHDRLLAPVALGPLLGRPSGLHVCHPLGLLVLGLLKGLCPPQEGLLTRLQACAMSLGRGLCHLGLLCVERFDLVGHPLLSGRSRGPEVLALALLLPVGTDDRLAAIVGLASAMVDQACEAVCLSLRALAVAWGPRAHLDGGRALWSAPGHERLALCGHHNHPEARVVVCGGFPRSTLDLTAIVQGPLGRGRTTLEALVLVIIEPAQHAPILLGTGHRPGQGIDRPVDDTPRAAGGLDHLVTVGNDEPREMDVGRMRRHKDGLARFVVANDGLRARHDAAPHGDRALGHGHPTPRGDPRPITRRDLAGLGRYQRGHEGLIGPDALQWSQERGQGGALIAATEQRGERRRARLTLGAVLDATEGSKKAGLKTVTQRLLAVMSQGQVIVRRRVLLDLSGLRELGHHQVKGPLVVEPMRQEMHAHTRQTGPDADDRCSRDSRPRGWRLTRTSLAPIALPLDPPPIALAQADRHRSLPLRGLVESQPARALWVCLEQAPQQGLLQVAELSAGTKRWT